jgi:hypothetical protein
LKQTDFQRQSQEFQNKLMRLAFLFFPPKDDEKQQQQLFRRNQ